MTLDLHLAGTVDDPDVARHVAEQRATMRVYASLLLFTMTFAAVAALGAWALGSDGGQLPDLGSYGDGLIVAAATGLVAFPALGAWAAVLSRRIARSGAAVVALALNVALLLLLLGWTARVLVS